LFELFIKKNLPDQYYAKGFGYTGNPGENFVLAIEKDV